LEDSGKGDDGLLPGKGTTLVYVTIKGSTTYESPQYIQYMLVSHFQMATKLLAVGDMNRVTLV
jgi:hypothetical protein